MVLHLYTTHIYISHNNCKTTKMYNVRNLQTMSSDPLRVSDVMLDSLTHQLREAESRRAEAERAHQVRKIIIFLFYIQNYYYYKIISGFTINKHTYFVIISFLILFRINFHTTYEYNKIQIYET